MTAMELNAEISHQLSLIADDENTLQRVLKYMKRLAARKEKTMEEEEYISKEELLTGIREGLLDMKEAQRTGEKLKTLQEVIDEL
ncbi:MAG: hypothetical protein LBN06_05980 [Prevotellaceae bacterium]|jgi:hypothetical protein|nr:hypothetical protein [Prevotellaceae bacterium]